MANLAGFQSFVSNVMQVDDTDLPPDNPAIAFSFAVAKAIVNPQIALVGIPGQVDPTTGNPISLYDLAVYNLAADYLVNYAIDPEDAPLGKPDVDGRERTFWERLRFKWGIGNFQPGVVNSVSDVSTSTSLTVSEALSTITLADLQNLKTPYGRQYLAIAQRYGTLWGLT